MYIMLLSDEKGEEVPVPIDSVSIQQREGAGSTRVWLRKDCYCYISLLTQPRSNL